MFDASTLSQNRRRRYQDASIPQVIFDRIVEQAMGLGLIEGTTLYTDSTHLKASANKNQFDLAPAAKSRAAYWEALDAAVEEDRPAHRLKPLAPAPHEAEVKETKLSRTDPEAGYMVRDGKPKGFFYLDHRTSRGALASSLTPTQPPPMSMTASPIWKGSTGSGSALAWRLRRLGWTRATPPPPSPRALKTAGLPASPAIARRPRRGQA